MMNKIKGIPGWEGIYAITRDGRVWAYPRVRVRGTSKLHYRGYWRKSTLTSYGYRAITLYPSGSGARSTGAKRFFIHQLVARTYIPEVKGKHFVNHIDGDKQNNRVYNLEWCTYKENTHHAFKKGLRVAPKGEQHGMSKLTEQEVRTMRESYSKGVVKAELARSYGISRGHAAKICNVEIWKHVV